MKRGRGRPPEDPARLEARGALRSHPSRYGQPLPKVAGTLRRERYRKSLESRILTLSARLLAEAKELLQFTLTPREIEQLRDRLGTEKSSTGVYCEMGERGAFAFVVEQPEGVSLGDAEILATILPRGARVLT